MPTLPSWLQPQDVVGAYLGGAARGDASRRTALAERSQAAEEQQAQQSFGLQQERLNQQARSQEFELAESVFRSQAQQAAAQERVDLARAIREQKAAEAATRFEGASEFSRLVSQGMPTDRALLQAGQKMFYNKPDALMNALQKDEQQSALKLFRDEEQRRKLDAQIGQLNQAATRASSEAEKLMLTGRLRDIQSENTRLREGELGRRTEADEAKARNDYVKLMAQDGVESTDATYNWQRLQNGEKELSVQELNDRRASRAALSQLETYKRAGQSRVTIAVKPGSQEIIVGKPWTKSGGELIDDAIARYRENIGGTNATKSGRVRVRNKKTNKPGWWEGGDPIDESLYEIIH